MLIDIDSISSWLAVTPEWLYASKNWEAWISAFLSFNEAFKYMKQKNYDEKKYSYLYLIS